MENKDSWYSMVSEKNKVHSHTAAANTIVLAVAGIFLGNLAGIGFVIGMDDTLSHQIAAVLIAVSHANTSPAQFSASLGGAQGYILALLLGLVISPAIMSGIARRLPVLWGMVPTVVFCFWLTAEYMSANSTRFSVPSVVDTFLFDAPLILIGVASSLIVHAVKHYIFIRHSSR
jgi:hypothetical protein